MAAIKECTRHCKGLACTSFHTDDCNVKLATVGHHFYSYSHHSYIIIYPRRRLVLAHPPTLFFRSHTHNRAAFFFEQPGIHSPFASSGLQVQLDTVEQLDLLALTRDRNEPTAAWLQAVSVLHTCACVRACVRACIRAVHTSVCLSVCACSTPPSPILSLSHSLVYSIITPSPKLALLSLLLLLLLLLSSLSVLCV